MERRDFLKFAGLATLGGITASQAVSSPAMEAPLPIQPPPSEIGMTSYTTIDVLKTHCQTGVNLLAGYCGSGKTMALRELYLTTKPYHKNTACFFDNDGDGFRDSDDSVINIKRTPTSPDEFLKFINDTNYISYYLNGMRFDSPGQVRAFYYLVDRFCHQGNKRVYSTFQLHKGGMYANVLKEIPNESGRGRSVIDCVTTALHITNVHFLPHGPEPDNHTKCFQFDIIKKG